MGQAEHALKDFLVVLADHRCSVVVDGRCFRQLEGRILELPLSDDRVDHLLINLPVA